MPVALTTTSHRPAASEPPRKVWTRAESAALQESGAREGRRWELIEGELIDKMPKGQPHTYALARIVRWLNGVFDWVYPEAPINLAPEDTPTSEPEPDAIVLKPEFGGFRPQQPRPSELALVVEVSDTTLNFDLTMKAAL